MGWLPLLEDRGDAPPQTLVGRGNARTTGGGKNLCGRSCAPSVTALTRRRHLPVLCGAVEEQGPLIPLLHRVAKRNGGGGAARKARRDGGGVSPAYSAATFSAG